MWPWREVSRWRSRHRYLEIYRLTDHHIHQNTLHRHRSEIPMEICSWIEWMLSEDLSCQPGHPISEWRGCVHIDPASHSLIQCKKKCSNNDLILLNMCFHRNSKHESENRCMIRACGSKSMTVGENCNALFETTEWCQKLGKPYGIWLQRVENINKREIPLLILAVKRTTHVNEVDPNFAIFRIWRWAGLGELGERWATFSHIYTQYYVLRPKFSDSHDPDPRNPAV